MSGLDPEDFYYESEHPDALKARIAELKAENERLRDTVQVQAGHIKDLEEQVKENKS